MNDENPVNPLEVKVALLEKEVARLTEVLRPFADHASDWTAKGFSLDESLVECWPDGPDNYPLTVSHLVNAKYVLDTPLI